MVTYLGGSILITIFALGGSIVSYNLQRFFLSGFVFFPDSLNTIFHKIPGYTVILTLNCNNIKFITLSCIICRNYYKTSIKVKLNP